MDINANLQTETKRHRESLFLHKDKDLFKHKLAFYKSVPERERDRQTDRQTVICREDKELKRERG